MKENGLNITSKANVKVVDFLDVTLDLQTESYRPFIKPGDQNMRTLSQTIPPQSSPIYRLL